MASSVTDTLPNGTVMNLISKLSPDDKEKGFLLARLEFGSMFDGSRSSNCNHLQLNKAFWTEIVFVNQRYDLLRLMEVSEDVAFELLNRTSSFPIVRRLLVKLYDAIPKSKEKDFACRMARAISQSEGSEFQSLTQTLINLEEYYNADRKGFFSKVKEVLDSLELAVASSELAKYCTANEALQYEEQNPVMRDTNIHYYPMDKTPCGRCVIINNKIFKEEPEREGSEIDVELLKKTFENFDFVVELHENLDYQHMLKVLKTVADDDHTKFNAFVCCIMSHGENCVVFSTDGLELKIHDVRMTFCRCKTLNGKPKMFFYQACRGKNVERACMYVGDGVTDKVHVEDSQKDCLTGMATVEGTVAFRSSQTGSCFIRSLVRGLNRADPLSKVQLWVNEDVAKLKIPAGKTYIGQTPEWVNTLTGDLKFRKKKDIFSEIE